MKELQEIITNISVLLLGTGMYFIYNKLDVKYLKKGFIL